MERSGSQKFLLVISIINIIAGVFIILGSLLLTLTGGVIGSAMPSDLASAGIDADDARLATAVFSFLGVAGIFSGALGLLEGILGVRAANDSSKIMPVWVLTLISLILNVVGLIMVIINGTFASQALTYVFALVLAALMFWVANNIKNQAGR